MAENILHWMAGLFAYTTLGIILYGIWRGTQRQVGRTSGRAVVWLRSPVFYLAASALFFGISYVGWIPLPLMFSPPMRTAMLAVGALVYVPGMSFVLWGRLALGKNYFVSTGLGAQLFAGHQLIINGPYAIVRHPMYVGLILAAVGSLLIYLTWTTLFFACFASFVTLRVQGEERALAAEFGEQWVAYCKEVPAFIPRLKR